MPSLYQKRRAYLKKYAQNNSFKKTEYNKKYYAQNVEKAKDVSKTLHFAFAKKKEGCI